MGRDRLYGCAHIFVLITSSQSITNISLPVANCISTMKRVESIKRIDSKPNYFEDKRSVVIETPINLDTMVEVPNIYKNIAIFILLVSTNEVRDMKNKTYCFFNVSLSNSKFLILSEQCLCLYGYCCDNHRFLKV